MGFGLYPLEKPLKELRLVNYLLCELWVDTQEVLKDGWPWGYGEAKISLEERRTENMEETLSVGLVLFIESTEILDQ
jgi:hypothetical protein